MTNTTTAATIASADFAARVEALRAAYQTAGDDEMVDICTNALEGFEVAQLVVAEILVEQGRSQPAASHISHILTVSR